MSKGNSTGTERNDGADVNSSVAQSNREECLEVSSTELGSFSDSQHPKRDEIKDTDGHLNGGDGPGEIECIERLFVVDIVRNVEQVPKRKVAADLQSLEQRVFTTRFTSFYRAGRRLDRCFRLSAVEVKE